MREKKLETQNNFAQFYFDHADVFMVALNGDGIVTDVNKKACEVLGHSADEIKGKNWFNNFIPKAKREDAKRNFHSMLLGSLRHVHYEYPVIAKHGEKRTFDFHNILVSDKKGSSPGRC